MMTSARFGRTVLQRLVRWLGNGGRPARRRRAIGGDETLERREMLSAYVVTTLEDVVAADGRLSLREAVLAANTNQPVNEAIAGEVSLDGITFADDAFDPSGERRVDLTSELPIAGRLRIDGGGVTLNQTATDARLLDIGGGSTVVRLADLTLTGGNLAQPEAASEPLGGAAIRVRFADLFVDGVTFDGNTVTRETRTSTAPAVGGAIWADSADVSIVDSQFTGNTAQFGGAIWASGRGAGYAQLTIEGSTFAGNSVEGGFVDRRFAQGRGGAIGADQAIVRLTDSRLTGNAANVGGAIAIESSGGRSGQLHLTNTAVDRNTASRDGGGIAVDDETIQVTLLGNTRLLRNTAGGVGGGIATASSLTMRDSWMAANRADGIGPAGVGGGGGAIYAGRFGTFFGPLPDRTRPLELFVAESRLLSNRTTQSNGGAIWLGDQGTLTATDAVGRFNRGIDGGFLYAAAGTTTEIVDSSLVRNAAHPLRIREPVPGGFRRIRVGGFGGAIAVAATPGRTIDTPFPVDLEERFADELAAPRASLLLERTVVARNNAAAGGGVFVEGSAVRNEYGRTLPQTLQLIDTSPTATIVDSSLLANRATVGGAIATSSFRTTGPRIVVSGGAIRGNRAAVVEAFTSIDLPIRDADASQADPPPIVGGGALFARNGEITLNGVYVGENASEGDGGALLLQAGAQVELTDTIGRGNTAAGFGGFAALIDSETDTPFLISPVPDGRLTIVGGRIDQGAATSGGGIAAFEAATVELIETVTKDNAALEFGGGLYSDGAATALAGVLFQRNTAGIDGDDTFEA